MAEVKEYKMAIRKTLQFCIEVQKAENMTTPAAKELIQSLGDTLTKSVNKCVVKFGDLIVLTRSLPANHPFTFSSVHNDIPLPKEVEKFPMVIEIVFQESNSAKLFVRIKNDLDFYDGVSAVHTGFQVLELLDNIALDRISPYPFHGNNGAIPGASFGNFFAQVSRVLFSAATAPLFPTWWQGKWMPGAWQSSTEATFAGQRVCKRFYPDNLSFRDILKIMDQCRIATGKSHFATTVNYAPQVCLALVPNLDILSSKEGRLSCIALPPVGVGPPPSMDAMHTAGIHNSLFFNNYGKHNPKISGQVTDFLWDWMGMYATFNVFCHCTEIQGKKIVRFCAHPEEWKLIEPLLEPLGKGEAFQTVPFYKS